ncbi:hypothetical protein LOZ65_004421 [Ophidiomyces ophidiicola]|nr:hypothetical protein LOZ65_004421 [Ophidiomyces ophidiicola]
MAVPLRIRPQYSGHSTGPASNDGRTLKPTLPRGEFLSPDTFSPVNENGSFEFDRVLKRGKVLRRSKNKHSFKASWKPGYLVLRPNLLSLYKDEDEAQLRLSITLSDISTVAHVKAPRSHRPNVFGIFSPSNNYRFQAPSKDDAECWVEHIRRECSVEYPDTFLASDRVRGVSAIDGEESAWEMSDHDGHRPDTRHSTRRTATAPRRSQFLEVSGNDITSCSEFSDVPPQSGRHRSTGSLPRYQRPSLSPAVHTGNRPSLHRHASHHSDIGSTAINPERVVFSGYLSCLRGKKGVRQWKKLWTVLRAEKLSFYKNEQEYSAVQIIPLRQVIDAADVDPISRSKVFCFQLITEEQAFRFCAPDEQSLDQWLGSLKSVLMRDHGAPRSQPSGPTVRDSSSGVQT